MIGYIIGRVVGRTILTIGVDAEDTKVARMTRPHPIVLVPAKLTNGRGRGKHQADIIEVLIDGKPKFITAVIGIDHTRQRGIFL